MLIATVLDCYYCYSLYQAMRLIDDVSLTGSTLVRCYWCISILIIIPNRYCFLTSPICYRSAAMLLDCRHPCFKNFDFPNSIDVIRMKSYVNGLILFALYVLTIWCYHSRESHRTVLFCGAVYLCFTSFTSFTRSLFALLIKY